ncbi:Erythroid differentiation-related factor 1 [Holothuria leucospilota]|uniref:Erythroid differentiation-related factor 1 n=1 Tax=Holothuria leucospilota TaxID=206669 RepID=A0A9Q0YQR8_HOLLE|nr:Erythroid differentiation-related factor 1 [Holothuria leucospilota]
MAESPDYQEQVKDSEGEKIEKEVDKVNSTVTCVLKSSQGNVPKTFSRVELNTNLHQPPSNWLKSGTPIDARNTWVRGGSGEFSSFRMAKQRPEQVGEVDVITASENIKKLLKIPFSSNQVSMAVHRVEKTLLLDELDLIKMLRHTSETGRNWVKEWLLRMVLQDGQTLTTERKTNQMLQNQNLLSKFLCYSVGEQDVANDSSVDEKQDCSVVPLFPPEIQQPEGNEFARQVLWEFEDIRMLIGSDLPIFGEGKYPAVSLRLKDMTSPISVLTGMDYWLDNLMCNVPELVMCYHLNGIVQKYEMLKTEEIPHLEDAKFSTKVVKDIAQNILSFLKSNCTKEGHTYWLYKGKDGDVVKLYDLTSLCENFPNCPWDNPFIVPVALLLYRVAKNMWAMNPTKKQTATISKLLKECVRLLQESGDRHPEISSSAYYMLTLIHINDKYESPVKSSPTKKEFQDSLSSESSDSDGKEIMMPEVKCQELTLPSCPSQKEFQGRKSPKRRVKKSDKNETVLEYIIKGLRYIHLSSPARIPLRPPPHHSGTETKSLNSGTSVSDELTDVPSKSERTATDDIPSSEISQTQSDSMVTESIIESEHQSCTSLSVVSKSQTYLAQSDTPEQNDKENLTEIKLQHFAANSWQMEQQVVLLSQAAHVYLSMAEDQLGKKCYGMALLYCKIGLACNAIKFSFSQQFPNLDDQKDLSQRFWVSCGDALLLMTNDPSKFEHYKRSLFFIQEKHAFILAVVEEMMAPEEWSWNIKLNHEKSAAIQSSIECYTKALEKGDGKPSGFLVSVARKIGNAKNELGVYIMNQATQAYKEKKDREVSSKERDLWAKSLSCLQQGIQEFEEVKDEANIALLLCNSGRLMRLCAQSHSGQGSAGETSQLSKSEIHYFHQAFKYYEQALSRLGRRKKNSHVWDAVSWELCTARYSFGCLLQDYPPLNATSQEEVEREIQECFNKALHLCELEDKSAASQPLYQYRIASIHHRLASMHHNIFRNQGDPQKQKRTLALVELHYSKAFTYFTQQERHLEVLRIQLERVAVLEHQLSAQTGHNSRIKLFQLILEVMTSMIDSLNSLKLRCPSSCGEATSDAASSLDVVPGKDDEKLDPQEQQEISKLLPLLESRLKFNLLGITKQLSNTKSNPKRLELYKKTYANLLAATHSTLKSGEITAERISTVVDILKQIKSLSKSHQLV